MMMIECVHHRQTSPAPSNSSQSANTLKQPNMQRSAVRSAAMTQLGASGSQSGLRTSDNCMQDVAASPQQAAGTHDAKASELDRQLRVSLL